MKKLLIFTAVVMFMFGCTKAGKEIPLDGADNFRDMGGYKTMFDKKVRYGMVFRSGDLNALTDSDFKTLEKLNIHTVIDFRSNEEVEANRGSYPVTVRAYLPMGIDIGNVYDESFVTMTEPEAEAFITASYIDLVTAPNAQEQYRKFFRSLTGENGAEGPFLFHCSAGKDRTGVAAALFLLALGADRDTVYKDYMLSAKYVKEKYAPYIQEYPNLAPLFTVKKEYIEAALDTIDRDYNDVYSYLQNQLEVDIEALKAIYTE